MIISPQTYGTPEIPVGISVEPDELPEVLAFVGAALL